MSAVLEGLFSSIKEGDEAELERRLAQLAPKDINLSSGTREGDTAIGAAARAGTYTHIFPVDSH